MTPYTSFYFFLLMSVLLFPSIIMGLFNRTRKWAILLINVCMITVIFWDKWGEFYFLAAFSVWQWLLIKGYLQLRQRQNSSLFYYGGIVLSLLPLIWAKVAPLLTTYHFSWIGFLGISYLTFKCLQMIIEIRDGQIKTVSVNDYIIFLWFFPTITSGPIDRYRRFTKDLGQRMDWKEYKDFLYRGIDLIFRGFLYKFLIGYLIQTYLISLPLLTQHTFEGSLLYMYAYSLYLFFDFAGYSAFAVGVSYLLGIKTPDNFNKPFISRNIKDFWNRWHMSLSYWFRDYVFMRVVLLLTKKKIFRSKYATSSVGYVFLFGLMGLWHGLQLHYIVYGFYHAGLMIGYDGIERMNKRWKLWTDGPIVRGLSIIVTLQVVCFGFLIFSGRLF